MRLFWARVGKPHCPVDGKEIRAQTPQEIVDQIIKLGEKGKKPRILILAPIIKGRKGIYEEVFEDLRKKGFVRVRVDGKVYEIGEVTSLARYKIHDIDAVIDRVELPTDKQRITESIETALKLGEGVVYVHDAGLKVDKI